MIKLTDNIIVLEAQYTNFNGGKGVVHPVLITGVDGPVLVDTSMVGSYDGLAHALREAGVEPSSVQHILISHQDIDHIGGLPGLLHDSKPSIEVYAHSEERPYIECEIPLLKFNRDTVAPMLASASDEVKAKLEELLNHPPFGKVNRIVVDGELLPLNGGIRVIHTPGHTPGHLCFYLEQDRILLASDALRIVNGELVGPAEEFTPDMPQALQSLLKLTSLDIARVVCYHGGVYEGNPSERIAEIVAENSSK